MSQTCPLRTNGAPRPFPRPARLSSTNLASASTARPSPGSAARPPAPASRAARSAHGAEHEILFQKYFKSVGPRTYASQVKRANNGNHYLVLTEGKRDRATGEVRKTRLFVFSEDFIPYFRMLQETAQFIREHPVSRRSPNGRPPGAPVKAER